MTKAQKLAHLRAVVAGTNATLTALQSGYRLTVESQNGQFTLYYGTAETNFCSNSVAVGDAQHIELNAYKFVYCELRNEILHNGKTLV